MAGERRRADLMTDDLLLLTDHLLVDDLTTDKRDHRA